ncbi:MAG: hypothetical protein RLO17_09385 [Cyclobacteriaceae bacterium]
MSHKKLNDKMPDLKEKGNPEDSSTGSQPAIGMSENYFSDF